MTLDPEMSEFTLRDLITETKAQDDGYRRIALDLANLQFVSDGLMLRDELVPLDQVAQNRLFHKVGAPVHYFEKCSRKLQAEALSEHAQRGHFGLKPKLVIRGKEVITIADSSFAALTNAAVLWAVQQGLGYESENLFTAKISYDNERLDLELVSRSKQMLIRPGDIVQAGLHIVHHRFGGPATLIEAFVLRLICSNGMTRRECVQDGIARTRRLPADRPNSRELQLDQIRRLTEQTWQGLQTQLDALQSTSTRSANVQELLTRWLQRARISVNGMMPRLLAAWRLEGEENTHFGAVNALTRVATHDLDLSSRQRRMLAALAGILAFSEVHVCPRCFSVLNGNAADDARDNSAAPVMVEAGQLALAR